MTAWKKVLVIASLGAGAVLFFKRRTPAGVAATTVGLAVLAAEYPEHFENIWENAPTYVTRGMQIFQTLSQVSERVAEYAAQRGAAALHEISPGYQE